ncbi:hypothetical protein SAMN06265376_11430 [Dokdonia pacifica]|uniref:Lipoprotein n=2 Tax=Dokdonia pacifica TaxID=1627892 RepID=A0A239E7I7_9FLAO|nr:hypothetical protein SAMN06265376_11430 [Dokdonia pacifica]
MRVFYTLGLGLLIASCTDSANQGRIISVLNDRTEYDFVIQPNSKMILPLFQLKDDPWQQLLFRYGELNDLEHNSRHEVSLEAEVALFGNEFKRRAKVKRFQKNVVTILDQTSDSTNYQNSTIWEPLVKELLILQRDTTQRVILYVFSDLRENASWFSTYRYSDIQLLENNSKAVELLFLEKAQEIIPSAYIEVIVVYQPQTLEQDQSFKQMSHLYREVFNELGITISFVANLKDSGYGT